MRRDHRDAGPMTQARINAILDPVYGATAKPADLSLSAQDERPLTTLERVARLCDSPETWCPARVKAVLAPMRHLPRSAPRRRVEMSAPPPAPQTPAPRPSAPVSARARDAQSVGTMTQERARAILDEYERQQRLPGHAR